jgi:hypothetical protein
MANTNLLDDPLPTGLSGGDDLSQAASAVEELSKFVQAATGLMDQVSSVLPDETRSIVVEVDNVTPFPMIKITDNFGSGGFGTLPNPTLSPYSSNVFSGKSGGIATGVSGSVTYSVEGTGQFLIGFDNPFLGSNAVNVKADPAIDAVMQILGEKTDGNHNQARFAILQKSPAPAKGQSDWRACPKCQGLFFGPFGGVCPKGGTHDTSKSFDYLMIFDSSPSSQMQTGWRACKKCQGMYFGGFPQQGVCPAQGSHDQANSFEYAIMFNVPLSDGVQQNWNSCNKCQGLFFQPNGGVCPKGGAHDGTGSFNYGLRFRP